MNSGELGATADQLGELEFREAPEIVPIESSPGADALGFNEEDLVVDQEKLKQGDMTVTTFEMNKGQLFSDGYGKRKHMFPKLDVSTEEPVPGVEYVVEVINDTDPGEKKGSFVARIHEPTEWGEVQLEKMGRGFHRDHLISVLYNPDGTVRTDEELEDAIEDLYPSSIWDVDVEMLGPSDSDPGGLSGSGSIWVRLKSDAPSNESLDPQFKENAPENILPIETSENGKVRFLDIEVDMQENGGRLVPPENKFDMYTLDERTLRTVFAVASAYSRRSPLFLEGDTAVSKTSAVEYFASQINAEVRRLNLSGQVSTGDLIGRFIPNDDMSRFKFDRITQGWNSSNESEREAVLSKLDQNSQDILNRAYQEQRELSKTESSQIAVNQGLNISDSTWVWKHGALTEAMIKGQVVILDEITLADPQIVERINSVLERNPSLVLDENGGLIIGPGGDFEVHENFWLVGTGNPGGMGGRTPLTPAFLRRWRDYELVTRPSKEELKEMMIYMISGEQPKVDISFLNPDLSGATAPNESGGMHFQAETNPDPPFKELQDLPRIEIFLERLAAAHIDIQGLSQDGVDDSGTKVGRTIGKKSAREGGKYVYTRETLVTLIERFSRERVLDLEATAAQGQPVYSEDLGQRLNRALDAVYIKTALEEDRKAITDILGNHGLVGFFKPRVI